MTTVAPFVISHLFDAPRELLWAAFTEADRLTQWWGPKGFGCEVIELNPRPGGLFRYVLRSAEGTEMCGRLLFREVDAPRRIVQEVAFCDAAGNLTRHPFSPEWPLRMHSTTTFEEKDGGTLLTNEWFPLDATEAENNCFDEGRAGCVQGFEGTFESLTNYLKMVR